MWEKEQGPKISRVINLSVISDVVFYPINVQDLYTGFHAAAVLFKRRIVSEAVPVNAFYFTPESLVLE